MREKMRKGEERGRVLLQLQVTRFLPHVPGGNALTEQVKCTVEAVGSIRDPRTPGFCGQQLPRCLP